jgi:hypothetical protein
MTLFITTVRSRQGHVKSNCFKLMKKKQVEENGNGTRNGVAGTVTDIVLSSVEAKEEVDHEIWIGDSGALCHYCNDNEGLYEYKTISEEITVGNGNVMIAKRLASYDVKSYRNMVKSLLSRLRM